LPLLQFLFAAWLAVIVQKMNDKHMSRVATKNKTTSWFIHEEARYEGNYRVDDENYVDG
jgi:hypothetical protein